MTTKDNIEQVVVGLEVILNKYSQQSQDPCKQFVNQKRLDENFHKYKLVQRIVTLLKEALANDIDKNVTYERLNKMITNEFSEGDQVNELSKNVEFQDVLEKILGEVDAAVSQMDGVEGERASTPLSIPSASGWDPIVEQSANLFDDSIMITSAQRKQLAKELESWNDVETRRNAIRMLQEMTPVDVVPNEHWDLVIKSLSGALGDPDEEYVSIFMKLTFMQNSDQELGITCYILRRCTTRSNGRDLS
jgi:hypothetical protein